MYLKRLDLHGFKSFASKTSFDFGQGITAIVGPNGSGKSNIADALRWVLGEQSGRLLRAKKLDDIIYAGSAKRQRADKVEVTMTLDNSDGWLPIATTEVAISRRGSRNGDSDYFINGKKARLRELQALLANANVSQNSYAIIGQGLVESILNLRPDERRELIEEAADIQRYRLKIEEAQARLVQTGENVERVRLLIKEIAPRLTALERQARRAGEHTRLTHELHVALQAFYEDRWLRAEEGVTVARAAHDQAQAEFTQAKVALGTVQRELDDITSQLEQQRRAAAASSAERDRLQQQVHDLERRLAVAQERGAILETRQAELEEELRAVEAERERTAAMLAAEASDREQLSKRVVEARSVLDARQADLTALEREFREATAHAAEAEARGKRLETAAADMKARRRRLEESQKELDKEASRLETRRRSLVSQMAEILRVLRSLRAQESQVQAQVSGTGARRQLLESEIQEARGALAKIEATQNERRGKLEGLQARLSVLTEAQSQAQASEPQSEVTIEGALTLVYEMIRVPRGLEEAIAAALAERLEAFVFERQADALAALVSLVQQKGPRTAVIALDGFKPVYPLNLIKEKGVLGVASQLVKFLPRYEKLVNALLGRTIVVQDVESARRLLKRGLGAIVTLDGIVFHPAGHVTGGQAQASRPFVLSYERDLESIPKELDRVQRSLAISEREADELRDRLRQAESALAALTHDADTEMNKRLSIQDSMSQRQQRLAQLRGELRGLIGTVSGLREQQRGLQQESARLAQERELALAEAAEAAATAKHLGKAEALFRQKQKELQQAVDAAADALARADGELRLLTVQRESAEATLARLEAQVSAKSVQLRGLEMELSTLQTTTTAEQKELAQASGRLGALMQQIQPGSEGTHHLEARQRDLHSQVLSCQGRLFEAERRVLESEAEVRRWETQIETLRSRIAEDGLVLATDGSIVREKEEAEIPYWLAAEGPDEGPGLRPIQGGAEIDPDTLAPEIERLRTQIRALGPVNVEAQVDYQSLRERHDFLAGQVQDLAGAEQSLQRAIEELTGLMRRRFVTTFEQVAENFERNFQVFFGGGHARLKLSDPKDPSTAGVEIEARPPGKRTQTLTQLSGGEKALTAVSLLFALLQVNPSPFCVLDEVDAMLDEANVGRFATSLRELAERTQFIVITHNRRTIEVADSIYGISMAPDAASRVLSMRLGDIPASSLRSDN